MKRLANTAVLFAVAVFSFPLHAADGSSLKMPPGAKVAIMVFEDLQCPDCAKAYPVLRKAAKAYDIPLVVHEFPLPFHSWAFQAAVYARFFDAESEQLGDRFRAYIYLNQPDITPGNLRQLAERFARDNTEFLPLEVDPEGKLKQEVQADYELGQRIRLEHTPTIFVIRGVIRGDGMSTDFVEVGDRTHLNQIIEDMLKKAYPANPAKRAGLKNKKIAA